MDASAGTRQQLSALHAAGFEISLDDFGTGYSALSYLHQFDLDYLKIDQSFVRGLHADSKDLALCKATIVMAHELGLKVVAEGIETDEQRACWPRRAAISGRATRSRARYRPPTSNLMMKWPAKAEYFAAQTQYHQAP